MRPFWDIFDSWLTDREWPGQHLQFLRCFIRSCRSNDKHKIQRRYEGSNICRICHNYGNFCQVKVTLLHKIFVAKYIFIFNRVLCCKNWKNETLIGITKMDFSKALFFVTFVKTLPIRFQDNDLTLEYLASVWTIKVVSEVVERGGWVRESTLCPFCPSRFCAVGTGKRARFWNMGTN